MSESFTQNLTAQNSASPLWASDDIAVSVIRTEQDKDALGFAFESIEEMNESPLEFEEYASALMDDLRDIYYLTGRNNRFSPVYITSCEIFGKIVRRLGSCCVTRALLEQTGISFPKLEGLSVEMLYGCVSANFRKCHQALQDGKQKNLIDMNLLNLEVRLYELSERLRSTAEKVKLIRAGKISADKMLERAKVFSSADPSVSRKSILPDAKDRKASAFPVLGSVARQILEERHPLPVWARPSEVDTSPLLKEAQQARKEKDYVRMSSCIHELGKLLPVDEEIEAQIREDFKYEEPYTPPMVKIPAGPTAELRAKLHGKRKKKPKRV